MCYDGIISIRGLCTEDSALYFLDDIGISLLTASHAADEKYQTGKKLIEAKIKQAFEDTMNDILFNGMEANKTLNDVTVGINTTTELAPFAGNRGLKFTLDKNCKLARFYLHKVTLSVKTGGETTIYLRENGVNTSIYTGTPDDGDEIEVKVNKYMEDTFQILADNTNIEVFSGSASISDCGCRERRYFTVSGSDGSSDNFGITADIQVRCDKQKHLCKYVDKIAGAAQYKAAAWILKEVKETSKLSDLLTIKSADVVTQMAWLDSTFNLMKYDPAAETTYSPKGMYQKELERLNIPAPKCKCCLECNSDGYTMVLP